MPPEKGRPRAFVFTGAGLSAPSGIPTFRGSSAAGWGLRHSHLVSAPRGGLRVLPGNLRSVLRRPAQRRPPFRRRPPGSYAEPRRPCAAVLVIGTKGPEPRQVRGPLRPRQLLPERQRRRPLPRGPRRPRALRPGVLRFLPVMVERRRVLRATRARHRTTAKSGRGKAPLVRRRPGAADFYADAHPRLGVGGEVEGCVGRVDGQLFEVDGGRLPARDLLEDRGRLA
jgi:hypothetical protein